MGDMYANSYPGARASCAKEQQQFYNYQAPPSTSNFNLEPFPSAQSCYKNTAFNSFDLPAWTEEALKIPDRIEMIEITSKDLSPASFCSNLDLFAAAPDLYKTTTPFNQWYNQKPVELPSCAQANIESSKYCSIQTMQKPVQDYYYNTEMFCEQPDYYNCFDNFEIGNFQPVVDQSSDSDIVVEESSDSDESPSEISKCFICNVKYTPLGTQFYHLGPKAPLTMSTQKPVFVKIAAILGRVCGITKRYLCSECLGLINTIDHLQMKLEGFSKELLQKFKKTCGENAIKIRKKKKACSAFKCKKCNRVLSLKHYHAVHMKKHKFRGFLCEVCGEIFKSKLKFLNHKETTHQKTKIPALNCSNCSKSFRTKSNLVEHKNYCLGTLPYNCKFCDKKFASSTKLKSHVKLKHDKKFVAICSICNTGFVNMSDYKAHKISHGSDKKFNCKKCGNAYKTLSNLNFHMKIHNKTMPFICTICDRGFTRKDYLEAHVNKHNGIKNYVCTICDKRFIWQKTLDSHLKSHDGTTKGKSCNVCGKVLKIGLEEHMRIHNNLREFECDQCDNRFNTKGTLAKHKKIKHNNK